MQLARQKFDIVNLGAAYDRGRLVPFIGSGMSSPACSSWSFMITQLERQAGIVNESVGKDLIQRALFALQVLRQQGTDIAGAISQSIYVGDGEIVPPQTRALASVYWPLVCTTNYDDIYFRAKMDTAKYVPCVLGRSETDCREVLEHLSFPTREVVWALQGLLAPRDPRLKQAFDDAFEDKRLERELVVGHAEYRREANRAMHFRRSFAELFRARSLFFLGSGLGEPYFLSLFDEIIELTGPPARPHFALVQEGQVDTDFLQTQYHILCNTYPRGQHQCVAELVNSFSEYAREERVRPGRWGFRLMSSQQIDREDDAEQFTCVRGKLPDVRDLPQDETVAISCGRKRDAKGGDRGDPLPSGAGLKMLGLNNIRHEWVTDFWTVRWTELSRAYGIVARELDDDSPSSRDRRSPEAIRLAFRDFLDHMHRKRVRRVHVQLLSAGQSRVFQPWVSLSQMARAYGEWFRHMSSKGLGDLPRATVYVVDHSVITLLQGGYLDLAQELQGTPLRISVEVIDAFGRRERHHQITPADARIGDLIAKYTFREPLVSARPAPRRDPKPKRLGAVLDLRAREFGLVSGSTLVVDYRVSSTEC
jgi:hypothetical protein